MADNRILFRNPETGQSGFVLTLPSEHEVRLVIGQRGDDPIPMTLDREAAANLVDLVSAVLAGSEPTASREDRLGIPPDWRSLAELNEAILRASTAAREHPPQPDENGRYAPELSDAERSVLAYGIGEWGGPCRMTEPLARLLGFEDVSAFDAWQRPTMESIERGEPLSADDWHKALAATEICAFSWRHGAAGDWDIVTTHTIPETALLLAAIQRKLAKVPS